MRPRNILVILQLLWTQQWRNKSLPLPRNKPRYSILQPATGPTESYPYQLFWFVCSNSPEQGYSWYNNWLSARRRSWGFSSGCVKNFLHSIQIGSGTPTSYPVGTKGYFLGVKAARTQSWPLTSKSRKCESPHPFPTCLHGVLLI